MITKEELESFLKIIESHCYAAVTGHDELLSACKRIRLKLQRRLVQITSVEPDCQGSALDAIQNQNTNQISDLWKDER